MHSLFKMFSQAVRALVLLVAAIVMMNGSALAHELSPAVADLSFEEDRFELRFEMNVEAVMAEIGPDHDDTDDSPNAAEYDALRALSADELKERFSAFSESFLGGLDVRTDDVRADLSLGEVDVPDVGDLRTETDVAEEGYAAFLAGGETSQAIAVEGQEARGLWAVLVDYVGIGFEHIIPLGLDHILFVIGLFLFSIQMRSLLLQVTAFTLAHTVTLALGMLGILTLPGSIAIRTGSDRVQHRS